MIFGSYPCCGAALAIAVSDDAPKFMPETCPSCGAKVWHWLSRVDPQSWTEADFLKEHEVDQQTKTVRGRNLDSPIYAPVDAAFRVAVENYFLYGDTDPGARKPAGLLSQREKG